MTTTGLKASPCHIFFAPGTALKVYIHSFKLHGEDTVNCHLYLLHKEAEAQKALLICLRWSFSRPHSVDAVGWHVSVPSRMSSSSLGFGHWVPATIEPFATLSHDNQKLSRACQRSPGQREQSDPSVESHCSEVIANQSQSQNSMAACSHLSEPLLESALPVTSKIEPHSL